MITKAEALDWARRRREDGFRILEHRDQLMDERNVDPNSYPAWVRELDRAAGILFAKANEHQALADGPAWKRWFA